MKTKRFLLIPLWPVFAVGSIVILVINFLEWACDIEPPSPSIISFWRKHILP